MRETSGASFNTERFSSVCQAEFVRGQERPQQQQTAATCSVLPAAMMIPGPCRPIATWGGELEIIRERKGFQFVHKDKPFRFYTLESFAAGALASGKDVPGEGIVGATLETMKPVRQYSPLLK
jgi:hypothetical protein